MIGLVCVCQFCVFLGSLSALDIVGDGYVHVLPGLVFFFFLLKELLCRDPDFSHHYLQPTLTALAPNSSLKNRNSTCVSLKSHKKLLQ